MKSSKKYTILGDFNIDVHKCHSLPHIKNYFNHINSLGCTQLINKPTRITESSETLTNHIYTNVTMLSQIIPSITTYDISDYLPVLAQIKLSLKEKHVQRPLVRIIKRENIDSFLADLELLVNTQETKCSNSMQVLIDIMQNLVDTHFPKMVMSRKQYKSSKKTRITKGILTLIKHQNKLFLKTAKCNCLEPRQTYKNYRKQLSHLKEKAKQNYYHTLFNNSKNPSETWKIMNKILRKKQATTILPNVIKVDENLINDPDEICRELNMHFSQIGVKMASKITSTDLEYTALVPANSLVLHQANETEIVDEINNLNNRKSPGYIDIPIVLIKEAKYIVASFLTRAFNFCINNGKYPDILKIAKVIPLHKGGSVTQLTN